MVKEIRKPDDKSLEAVYNLNKHAKKYARLADENYRKRKGATAKANSTKKKALYGVKSRAINRFLLDGGDSVSSVERHKINGDPFMCLCFEDTNGEEWSFHQPEGEIFDSRLPGRVKIEDRTLEGFESGEEKDRSNMSLKDTLLHMKSCGIDANDYLPQTYVDYASGSYFVGWDYL